jgi:hypothetical protein
MAMAQQKPGQLLADLPQRTHRGLTRTHEIADRLMGLVRDPDRRQFTGAVQLGEVDRIPPIGLDPLTGFARDQRRRDDDAFVIHRRELPLDAIATRSGFVAKPQCAAPTCELGHQCLQGGGGVRDFAILTNFPPLARLGQRHRDRILVHIQPDVGDRMFHDPSPMHEALHRPIRRNPR